MNRYSPKYTSTKNESKPEAWQDWQGCAGKNELWVSEGGASHCLGKGNHRANTRRDPSEVSGVLRVCRGSQIKKQRSSLWVFLQWEAAAENGRHE